MTAKKKSTKAKKSVSMQQHRVAEVEAAALAIEEGDEFPVDAIDREAIIAFAVYPTSVSLTLSSGQKFTLNYPDIQKWLTK